MLPRDQSTVRDVEVSSDHLAMRPRVRWMGLAPSPNGGLATGFALRF